MVSCESLVQEKERCFVSTDPVSLCDRLNVPARETRGVEDGTTTMSDEKGAG